MKPVIILRTSVESMTVSQSTNIWAPTGLPGNQRERGGLLLVPWLVSYSMTLVRWFQLLRPIKWWGSTSVSMLPSRSILTRISVEVELKAGMYPSDKTLPSMHQALGSVINNTGERKPLRVKMSVLWKCSVQVSMQIVTSPGCISWWQIRNLQEVKSSQRRQHLLEWGRKHA